MKEIIKSNIDHIPGFLDQMEGLIERTCIKEQKKNKLTPLKILANLP
jgi:hypothetical protein